MSKRVLIADLSNNNGTVSLEAMRHHDIVGFWHKVSEGLNFTDRDWNYRRDRGRLHGFRVGGYHFARPDSLPGAVLQAKAFALKLGTIKRRDLAPVLDLEVTGGLHSQQLVDWARAFNHQFHNMTGVWPLFYSYSSFIEGMGAERPIGRGLWLASYGRNDGKEYPYHVPEPFHKALAHQFTSKAYVPGVSGTCDLSSAPKLYPLLARGLRGL